MSFPPGFFKRVYARGTCAFAKDNNVQLQFVREYQHNTRGSFPDFLVPPGERLLCLSCDNNIISIFNIDTGNKICELQAPQTVVRLAWNTPHRRLLACSGDVTLWDLVTFTQVGKIPCKQYVQAAYFHYTPTHPLAFTSLWAPVSRSAFASTVGDLVAVLSHPSIRLYRLNGEPFSTGTVTIPKSCTPSETLALHMEPSTGHIFLASNSNHGVMVRIHSRQSIHLIQGFVRCLYCGTMEFLLWRPTSSFPTAILITSVTWMVGRGEGRYHGQQDLDYSVGAKPTVKSWSMTQSTTKSWESLSILPTPVASFDRYTPAN